MWFRSQSNTFLLINPCQENFLYLESINHTPMPISFPLCIPYVPYTPYEVFDKYQPIAPYV